MRLLQVSNGYPPQDSAGVELHTQQLSQALSARHAVAVLCRAGDRRRPEFERSVEEQAGVLIWRVNHNFLDAFTFERLYRRPEIEAAFRRVLAEWQPDLIHFQHCHGLSARLPEIAAEAGIPSVLTAHDYWYLCPTVQLLNARRELCPGTHHAPNCAECVRPADPRLGRLQRVGLYRWAATRIPALWKAAWAGRIAPSTATPGPPASAPTPETQAQVAARVEFMRRALTYPARLTAPARFVRDVYVEFGVAPEKIEVIPLGLEAARWRSARRPAPGRAGALHFAYVGGLLPHKGVDVVLRAFRQVSGEGHRLSLRGHADSASRYRREIALLAASDPRVQVAGPLSHADLPIFLQDVDVLVIPSLWHETYSFIAREGLLAGCWVLASDVGVFRELIEPGRNGQWARAGDVGAWAEALRATAANWPPAGFRAEASAPERLAPLDFAGYAARLEAVYQSVLERR